MVYLFYPWFVNISVYLLNDVLAFTVSPWYNQKERERMQKMEEDYYSQHA